MKDIPFLENIVASVWSQDTQKRLKAAEELSNYLSEPSNSIEFGGYDKLIDGLIAWVNSSNFRVSLSGLDILHQIVDKLGPGFKNSLLPVVPAIIERLGDSKQQVRDHAQDLIQKFMYPVSTPQHVLEQLVPAFSHKAWRVREEVLHCLVSTLTNFGASHITISKFVPHICKLLGDPNSQVRESAIETLVEIYRHVGEKVRIDLSKKGIPSSRLSLIYAKFDEVARSGTMELSEPDGPLRVNGDVDSEGGKTSPTPSRGGSAKKPSSGRKTSASKNSNSGAAAGAIDETDFANSYEDCPDVRIYSGKDLNEEMTKIQNVLSDDKNDWEQRIAAMKKIRSLICAGALEYDNCLGFIKNLEGAFKLNAKDLRSSVTRETCITLSYLSTKLGNQFDHTAEAILPCLINLIPNSAKIMATSGDACINIILKNTHAHRLITVLVNNMTSKSSVIRRNCASKLHLVLDLWDTHTIKNHVVELEDFIRKGISDADSECRATARRAFWAYHKHFPEKAESILRTLDASKQKQLENDRNGTGVIKATTGRAAPVRLPKPRSRISSSSSTHSEDGVSVRSSAPTRNAPLGGLTRSNHTPASRIAGSRAAPSSGYLSPMSNMGRSRSHIDSRAAERASRRAKTRATATRPPSPPSARQGRFPTRGYVSQPSSRSQSPDRLGCAPKERTEAFVHGTSPTKSKIPTPNRPRTSSRSSSRASSRSSSRGASRDPSPDTTMRRERRISEGKGFSPTQLPVLKRGTVQNPVVQRAKQQQPSADDEAGLTEAAVWDSWTRSPARRKYSFGSTNSHGSDDDADSDAGSSERSMGTRGNRTLGRAEPGNEIAEIVRLCNSNNSWSDRRDGVSALLVFLKSSRVMSDLELSKVKDCLTRLFFDPHNKVYSSFLDALAEFIVVHKVDIQDWLFVLLSRLLTKLGTEMLNSLQSKVVRVLDVVRDSFPYDLQFSILTRFITDQTQTPNLKVKIAVLQYLQGLISLMDPSDFTNSGETRLAVSRIISWTTEPKSAEVRKESAAVIVALFELNTPEFSMMLSVLPKSFQDGATKLLHSHLKSSSQGNEPISSSRGVASTRGYTTSYDETDTNTASPERPKLRLGYRSMSSSSLKGLSKDDDQSGRDSPGASTSTEGNTSQPEHRARTASPKLNRSPKTQQKFSFPSKSPKTNSGEGDAIGDSIDSRQSSPFKLRKQSKQDHLESHEDTPSVSSGYNSDDVNSAHGDGATGGHGSPRTTRKTSGHEYDPKQYQDTQNDFHPMPELNGFSTGRKKKTSETLDELDRSLEGIETSESSFEKADASALDQEDSLDALLSPLHDPSSEKMEDKRGALVDILRMVREDSSSLWNSFPKVFEALAKAVDDVQPSIRTLTLRVLKDMVRAQPFAFHQVSETTISKILQAHKDPQKEVVRQAEEAASMVAKSLLPEDCIRVLGPIIRDSEFPVSLAAIKMLTKVVEGVDGVTIEDNLSDMIPGLVKCYDHIESSVRKASVFCLVALHSIVGEEVLIPHLAELSGTKMKLLNLYIKRSQASAGGARP